MSINFQERFKNKSSLIGKQGNIDVDGSAAVAKPPQSQLFSSKQSFGYKETPPDDLKYYQTPTLYADHEFTIPKNPEIFDRKQPHSAKPLRTTDLPSRNEIKTSKGNKFIEEYKPYTLKDYQIIKSDKYYELGGLGPSSIGSEEWKQRKEMQEKRSLYAKQVKLANANLPPSSQRKPKDNEKDVSKRDKANQFARMIPRPSPKPKITKNEEVPALTSVLDELEKQHLAYKASVEAIKSGINK